MFPTFARVQGKDWTGQHLTSACTRRNPEGARTAPCHRRPDLAAERITDAVLGLGAIAVFVMTLVMYLTA